jgi:hypothetical protein
MKGLDPQPRPRRRISWTVVRFFAFLAFVLVVFSGASFSAGWLVKHYGGPPWLMVMAGCAMGVGFNYVVKTLVRRRPLGRIRG